MECSRLKTRWADRMSRRAGENPSPYNAMPTQRSQVMPYCARRCISPVRMCTSSGNRLSAAPRGSTCGAAGAPTHQCFAFCIVLLAARLHADLWQLCSMAGRGTVIQGAGTSAHRGVQALVAVGLGRRDVVLHAPRDRCPDRVHLDV